MAVIDPIDVDHGHDHEDEHLLQQETTNIFVVDQEVDHPLHCIGSSSLARVHSCTDQNNRFLELPRSTPLRKHSLIEYLFLFLIFTLLVMRSQGQKMYRSLFCTVDQDLLVEVKLIIAVILIQSIQVLDVLGEGVWIGEGELDFMLLGFEEIVERYLKFTCFTEDEWGFGWNTRPGGPVR